MLQTKKENYYLKKNPLKNLNQDYSPSCTSSSRKLQRCKVSSV